MPSTDQFSIKRWRIIHFYDNKINNRISLLALDCFLIYQYNNFQFSILQMLHYVNPYLVYECVLTTSILMLLQSSSSSSYNISYHMTLLIYNAIKLYSAMVREPENNNEVHNLVFLIRFITIKVL